MSTTEISSLARTSSSQRAAARGSKWQDSMPDGSFLAHAATLSRTSSTGSGVSTSTTSHNSKKSSWLSTHDAMPDLSKLHAARLAAIARNGADASGQQAATNSSINRTSQGGTAAERCLERPEQGCALPSIVPRSGQSSLDGRQSNNPMYSGRLEVARDGNIDGGNPTRNRRKSLIDWFAALGSGLSRDEVPTSPSGALAADPSAGKRHSQDSGAKASADDEAAAAARGLPRVLSGKEMAIRKPSGPQSKGSRSAGQQADIEQQAPGGSEVSPAGRIPASRARQASAAIDQGRPFVPKPSPDILTAASGKSGSVSKPAEDHPSHRPLSGTFTHGSSSLRVEPPASAGGHYSSPRKRWTTSSQRESIVSPSSLSRSGLEASGRSRVLAIAEVQIMDLNDSGDLALPGSPFEAVE